MDWRNEESIKRWVKNTEDRINKQLSFQATSFSRLIFRLWWGRRFSSSLHFIIAGKWQIFNFIWILNNFNADESILNKSIVGNFGINSLRHQLYLITSSFHFFGKFSLWPAATEKSIFHISTFSFKSSAFEKFWQMTNHFTAEMTSSPPWFLFTYSCCQKGCFVTLSFLFISKYISRLERQRQGDLRKHIKTTLQNKLMPTTK